MNEFQRAAGEQGRLFESAVEVLARIAGFEVVETHWRDPETGVEIDLVLERADTGRVWVECKGSWRGTRPGLERTDTLKKAIGTAAVLQYRPSGSRPYWLVVSHLPKPGSNGEAWLKATDALFDRVIQVGLPEPDFEDDQGELL